MLGHHTGKVVSNTKEQMKTMKFVIILLLILNSNLFNGQNINVLKNRINEILIDKDATVGISIMGTNPKEIISINGNKKLPMQSVYKYHLALTVLNKVEQGKLDLNDSIKITKQLVQKLHKFNKKEIEKLIGI